MTVDMRSKHPRTLICDGTATARAFRSETKERVSSNLHRHSCGCPPRQPMMQSYYSIDKLEGVCTLCWQRSKLLNHTRVRCPS